MQLQPRWCKFQQLDTFSLQAIFRLRQQVFIIEQQSIYADIDGLDPQSWHLLLQSQGQLQGYARLRGDSQQSCYKFERLVLAPPCRGQGAGRLLISQLIDKAMTLNEYPLLKLGAQCQLIDFYRQWHFEVVGEPYDDGGILHQDMQRPLMLKT
ncbi:GNAT family N-acetyltransferase [Bowmanella dokdonensis]|uniref:GNAT family N-acetyltransferase n=1 Tax=Bowmanella dokdonensis TaxID=751969 RepID=A0A939DQ48_9ALTE|nr:GNAT family N-acetyltransferase [Bowmanella dokdonensis]MBN7826732.1 GNAT family N-acetyltransferase [Bowmanella dokdonensis]